MVMHDDRRVRLAHGQPQPVRDWLSRLIQAELDRGSTDDIPDILPGAPFLHTTV